jgi:hypothetical protein
MNKTEDYMEENFTPELYTWIRQEARRIDASKKEPLRRSHLVSAAELEAKQNTIAREAHSERKALQDAKIQAIVLELDPLKIKGMVGSDLADQLKVHQRLGEDSTHKLTNISNLKVDEKKALLLELISGYLARHSELSQTTDMDHE